MPCIRRRSGEGVCWPLGLGQGHAGRQPCRSAGADCRSCTDKLSLPCRKAVCTGASFISSYPWNLGRLQIPQSAQEKSALNRPYFAFNETTRLVLEMQHAVCQPNGRNVSGLQGGEGRLGKLVQLLSLRVCSVCSEWAEIRAPAGPVYSMFYPQGKFSATVICQIGGEETLLVAVIRGCIILHIYWAKLQPQLLSLQKRRCCSAASQVWESQSLLQRLILLQIVPVSKVLLIWRMVKLRDRRLNSSLFILPHADLRTDFNPNVLPADLLVPVPHLHYLVLVCCKGQEDLASVLLFF